MLHLDYSFYTLYYYRSFVFLISPGLFSPPAHLRVEAGLMVFGGVGRKPNLEPASHSRLHVDVFSSLTYWLRVDLMLYLIILDIFSKCNLFVTGLILACYDHKVKGQFYCWRTTGCPSYSTY